MLFKKTIIVIAAAVFTGSCALAAPTQPAAKATDAKAAPVKTVAVKAAPAKTVAVKTAKAAAKPTDAVLVINGEKFGKSDVEMTMYKWYTPMLAEELITTKIVDQAARKAGVSVTDAQVQAKIAEFKQRALPPGADFASYLARTGRTTQYAYAMIRMNIQAESIMRKSIKLTPADFEAYRKASHILIQVPRVADEKEKSAKESEAKAQIEKIAQEIKNGKSFEAAAKEYGQDGTKDKGGDLGWFTYGQMIPDFEKVVFAMKPGTVSDPIKTDFGYHLIKLVALGGEAKGAAKKEIEEKIMQTRLDIRAWVAGLREKAQISGQIAPKPMPEMPMMGGPSSPRPMPRVSPKPPSPPPAPAPQDMPPPPPADTGAAPAAPPATN